MNGVAKMRSKNEILTFLKTYECSISLGNHSQVLEDIVKIITDKNQMESFGEFERPDAAFALEGFCYGVEHFMISMYSNNQGDSRMHVLGKKRERNKLIDSEKIPYSPHIDNLVSSLEKQLSSHARNFEAYQNHVTKQYPDKEYRLLIFIEDISAPSRIVVDDNDEEIIILHCKEIIDLIAVYKESLWGVIYTVGDEVHKRLYAYSMEELLDRSNGSWSVDKLRILQSRLDDTIGSIAEKDSSTIGSFPKEWLALSEQVEVFVKISSTDQLALDEQVEVIKG